MDSNALTVKKENAAKLHGFLKEQRVLDTTLSPAKYKEFVFFPVKKISKKTRILVSKNFGAKFVRKIFQAQNQPKRSLAEYMSKFLSKKEMQFLTTSFDSVGNIAVIQIPKQLEKKEKIIGRAVLEQNKNIKTVCKKTAPHRGKFRVEPVKIIAGKKNLAATYRESGCIFNISLGKVFFSPRLSNERLRIARQIKQGEIVGALFAGVGPFPIVFAKNSQMGKAFAVELNPHAVKNLKENIKQNKVGERVEIIEGDVRKVVPKTLVGKCDRVVMPLPKGAEKFLKEAIFCIKHAGGIIHYYDFAPKENPFEAAVKKIEKAAASAKKKAKILYKKELKDYSPKIVQIVVDFEVK